MPQLLRMPRPKPTQEGLEAAGANAIRLYRRSELMRKVLFYGGLAGLVGVGMLAEYLLTHFV